MSIEYLKLSNLKSGDNQSLIKFLDPVLNHDVTNKVWDWEFDTIDNTIFTVAKEGDVIAGTQSMLPIQISVAGNLIDSAKSETSYLSPDYRGRKIFEELYRLAVDCTVEKGSKVIWGFTPAVKAWKKNLKFHVYEECISDSEAHINYYRLSHVFGKSRNFIYGLAKFLIYNYRFTGYSFSRNKSLQNKLGLDVKDTATQPDLQGLMDKVKKSNADLVYIDINEAYLDWRVNTNPVLGYKKLFFYNGTELVGYLIYTLKSDGTINIADATYDTNVEVLEYMLHYVTSLHKEYYIMKYWGNRQCKLNQPIFDFFEKTGGKTKLDKTRNFVYQVYDTNLNANALSDLKNWYINGLWTEGFHI